MALNKSGLPPQKDPMEAAMRPGGPGTVKPGKAGLTLGSIGKGVPQAKLAKGGLIKYPKGMTNIIPKIGKIPTIK